ncbi:hypothetical protein ACHWQZ_G016300 [Mnemiopsis leidyi]
MTWFCVKKLLSPVIVAGSVLVADNRDVTKSNIDDESSQQVNFDDIVSSTKEKIMQKMKMANIPGSCCIVHINGKPIMKTGFGFSNIENSTPFSCKTSMRIASISKLITALMTLHFVQEEKVDLDKNLVDFFKSYNIALSVDDGEINSMTLKQLLNHTAGIRHYHNANQIEGRGDTTADEFFSNKNYPSIKDSLDIFIHDKLLFTPGTEFKYTTFGYSLLSFAMEKFAEKSFEQMLSEFTSLLGLSSTRLDSFEDIILNRCQYYCKKDDCQLKICPYVDNSNKWAGGGMVSTAEDIAKLGDILLYLYQCDSPSNYVKHELIESMIESNSITTSKKGDSHYGYGLKVCHEQDSHGKTLQYFKMAHSGGAVGACSNLVVLPLGKHLSGGKPKGITVVMFSNSCDGDVIKLAHEIAESFAEKIENELDCHC